MGFPQWLSGKELACQIRRLRRGSFYPWVGKIPWRRKWQQTQVFFPGASHRHMCVCVCAQSLSHVWLFATLWTVAHQASLSIGFSRQEHWSGLRGKHNYFMCFVSHKTTGEELWVLGGSQNDWGDRAPWKPKYYLILLPPHPILMWKFPAEDGKL